MHLQTPQGRCWLTPRRTIFGKTHPQRRWTNVTPNGRVLEYKLSKKEKNESRNCSLEAVHCRWFPKSRAFESSSCWIASGFSIFPRPSLFALRSCFPRCLGGAINRRVFTARFISFPYRQTLVWLCAQVRDRLQEKRKAKPRRKQQKHTPAANVCSILATFNGIELKLLPWCRVESVCTPTPTGPHKLFALPNFPCHRHFPSFANWNTRCTFLLWGMLPKKSKELQQPKNLLGQFFSIRSI